MSSSSALRLSASPRSATLTRVSKSKPRSRTAPAPNSSEPAGDRRERRTWITSRTLLGSSPLRALLCPQGRAYLHDRLPVRAASHEEHSLFEESLSSPPGRRADPRSPRLAIPPSARARVRPVRAPTSSRASSGGFDEKPALASPRRRTSTSFSAKVLRLRLLTGNLLPNDKSPLEGRAHLRFLRTRSDQHKHGRFLLRPALPRVIQHL